MKKLIILLISLWSINASAGLLELDWNDEFGGGSLTTDSTVVLDTGGYGSALLSSLDAYDLTNIDSMTFNVAQIFEGEDYFDQLWVNFYDQEDDGLASFSNNYYWGNEHFFSVDSLQIMLDLSSLVGFHFIDFEYWGDSILYSLTDITFNSNITTDPDNNTPIPEPSTLAIFFIALLMLNRRKLIK
jgi:hypothetical protein